MKRQPFVAIIAFFALYSAALLFADEAAPSPSSPGVPAGTADRPAAEGDPSRSAWIIPIRGDIEPSVAAFVRRETRRALARDARVVIFEIDTFGGRVDTALQITSFIGSLRGVETIAWVKSGEDSMGVSWSAGALIAMSCSKIYMANGTSIGAAAPVSAGANGEMEPLGEKVVSAVRSQMAALAEKNGHPPAIALAMVDQDVELWQIEVNGTLRVADLSEVERLEKEKGDAVKRVAIICPKGKLLSMTAGEAVRYGLAAGTADDADALLDTLGIGSEATASEPSIADDIVALLTSGPVQAILILIGLVALFLEINSPGFGVPGVIAIISFLGVFGSNALLGSVGSLEMILFLIGIGLLAVEIFVIPGFGVTGVSGLVLIGASFLFSMQDFVVPTQSWQWDILGRNFIVVSMGLIAAVVGIAIIALTGPRLRIFDRLTLNTKIVGTAGGPDPDALPEGAPPASDAEPEPDYGRLIGKRGTAVSTLRPSGKAEIEGSVYTVEADGSFIQSGAEIEVARVRGNRVIVKNVAERG